MRHFFCIGYYGFSNVGDDICLVKTTVLLQKLFKNCSCFYLAKETDFSRSYIGRYDLFAIFKSLTCCDALIFGGGGLLQTGTSVRSCIYYLLLILFAKLFQKPVYLLGQGVGPIKNGIFYSFFKYCISKVDFATLRDTYSLGFFEKKSHALLSSDLSFYGLSEQALFVDTSKHVIVGINICRSDQMKHLIPYFEKKQTLIKGLAFSPLDRTYLNVIVSNEIVDMNVDLFYKPDTFGFHYIIAMRYHSCIWAAIHGIPFIALAYDKKVLSLATSMKQPVIDCEYKQINLNELASFETSIVSEYTLYVQRLKEAVLRSINVSHIHEKGINEKYN